MLDGSEIQELIQAGDAEFDQRMTERMQERADKYGPFKFLSVDTLEEAMQEALDLGNYARMTYIKLYLLQRDLAKMAAAQPGPKADPSGFVPMKEFLQR